MASPISRPTIYLSVLLLLAVSLASGQSALQAEMRADRPFASIHEQSTREQSTGPRGIAGAELERAANYLTGRSVPRDLAQAAYWYRQAAEQGDPDAQIMIAYMCAKGIGVNKDLHQAVAWNLRAAASGSSEAKVNLASIYLRGEGVKQDTELALSLLQEAAKRQNGRAEAYLGVLYYVGLGVAIDRSQAESWFRKGARHHDPQAEYDMATIDLDASGHSHDLKKVASLLDRSCAKGYVPSMYALGLLLVNHPDVHREPGAEVNMLAAAAESGSWRASAVLGILARDGRYLPKDAMASYKWFRIAALQGGSPAESFLKTILDRLGEELGKNAQAQADRAASAWLLAHPNQVLFAFKNRIDPKYFLYQQVYAAIQDLEQGRKVEVRN